MKPQLGSFSLSFLLLTLLAAPSLAGGSSQEVYVEKIELESATRARIILKSAESQRDRSLGIRNCPKVEVWIDYRPHYTSRQTVTRSGHKEAIQYLQQASDRGQVIRFGEMGTGLARRTETPSFASRILSLLNRLLGKNAIQENLSHKSQACQFKTRGIALLEEFDSKQAVYTFHGPI